jgi:hypothetical protein
MIGGHGEQQLVDFAGKVGAIAGRRNQTALGIDADGNDDAAAALRAVASVANDFPARQAAALGEISHKRTKAKSRYNASTNTSTNPAAMADGSRPTPI